MFPCGTTLGSTCSQISFCFSSRSHCRCQWNICIRWHRRFSICLFCSYRLLHFVALLKRLFCGGSPRGYERGMQANQQLVPTRFERRTCPKRSARAAQLRRQAPMETLTWRQATESDVPFLLEPRRSPRQIPPSASTSVWASRWWRRKSTLMQWHLEPKAHVNCRTAPSAIAAVHH